MAGRKSDYGMEEGGLISKNYKKVLLMTPPHPPKGTSPMHYGDNRPPLGLGFLASYIRQFGHQAKILDNFLKQHDISKEVEEFAPDFIGIYVNTTSFLMALELIKQIKQCYPQIPIICGGPHVTVLPQSLLEFADYLVVGEGELALADILSDRAQGKIVRRNFIEDLDVLPWPDYRDFADRPYNWKLELYALDVSPAFTMNTSRGCPFRCQFCAVDSIWGEDYRVFSANKIVKEIEHLINRFNVRGIYFREDNFTAHRKRLVEFCDLLTERGIDIQWVCEARADLEEDLLCKLRRAGCRGFYVGAESGSQRVLDSMNKKISLAQMKRFFKLCKNLGIGTYVTICYGTPGETEEDRKTTEDFLNEIKPESIDRFAYLGVPRSPYYNYLQKNKLYYHIDQAGFIYTDIFKKLTYQLYPESDSRVQFLKAQEKELMA